MKAKVNKWFNAFLGILIGFLGYSCTEEEYIAEAYGVPSGDFTLDGVVTNEQKEPLPNIQIVMKQGWKDSYGVHLQDWPDTLYTDSVGQYHKAYGLDFPHDYRRIIANDTSGVYASDSIDSQITYSGGEGWYQGEAHLTADFVLKPQSK